MTISQERFNEKMDELDRQNPLPAYANALREAGWRVEEPLPEIEAGQRWSNANGELRTVRGIIPSGIQHLGPYIEVEDELLPGKIMRAPDVQFLNWILRTGARPVTP